MLPYIVLLVGTISAIAGTFWEPFAKKGQGKKRLSKLAILFVALPITANGIAAWQQWGADDRDVKRRARELNILWVDDNPRSKPLFSTIHNIGGHVTHAFSNKQALELLKSERFSHVITDMGRADIDDGLNLEAGLELVKLIRMQDKKTPVIILSSLAEGSEEKAYEFGATLVTNMSEEVFRYLLGLN